VTLPQVRRRMQRHLIRLNGFCPWCQTKFKHLDSS
jgi:hypothetical protein